MKRKGLFIVVEGPEGSGKSTALKSVYEELLKEGYDVVLTREPGGVRIAEDIRNIILDKNNIELDSRTEALLYAAARRQHLVENVIPHLNNDRIVLCDRFIHSSLAYQGAGRGLGILDVYEINKFAIDNIKPDSVIYLQLDPEIGLARINADKDREINRLDLEKLDFHKKVVEGYKASFLNSKIDLYDSLQIIDADKSKKDVKKSMKKFIKECIKTKGIGKMLWK